MAPRLSITLGLGGTGRQDRQAELVSASSSHNPLIQTFREGATGASLKPVPCESVPCRALLLLELPGGGAAPVLQGRGD